MLSRRRLASDLRDLGLREGDIAMVHASVRAVGPILGGVNVLVGALLDAVGPNGTLASYVDWEQGFPDPVDPAFAQDVPAFDKRIAKAARDHGVLAETIRTWPGCVRSDNPDVGVAAVGARAAWLCEGQSLSYGFGPQSPFAKLVCANAKIVLIGAPLDTITLLHHAEHLARIAGKRVKQYRRKILEDDVERWVAIEEFETAVPVVDGMPADHFALIAQQALSRGLGRSGLVGQARSYAFGAAEIVAEGIRWLEEWHP